jgi:cytochrome P450
MADFNPMDPAFIADPYPLYKGLRAQAPVYKHALGFYLVTRYDDVAVVLKDPRFGKGPYDALLTARFGQAGEAQGAGSILLFKDPPDHTRLRTLISKAFTPSVVEKMRPGIQAIVDRLLDAVAQGPGMDVIGDLAYPLPVTVISGLLGVPTQDNDLIKEWSADVARSVDAIATPTDAGVIERGKAGFKQLTAYFRGLCAERRQAPTADLLSALIAAEEQGDKLTEDELLGTCVLLYVAGHDTTVGLIGNGLLALCKHPTELRRLADSPELIGDAIEEVLRYDTPVQRVGRIAMEEVSLGGTSIPRGALVVGLLGAANRDPEHFPDPDRFDLLRRSKSRQLAFGWGIHFCLGAPLARLEGEIAIRSVLQRFPHLALTGAAPEWRQSATLRTLLSMKVSFGRPTVQVSTEKHP